MTIRREAHPRSSARSGRPPRSHGPRSRIPTVHEVSAGGVVIRRFRGRWHVALLKIRHTRGEVWVLPKGHVEYHRGETRDKAAVREVKEELGISNVRVLRKLGVARWEFMGTKHRRTTGIRPSRKGHASFHTAESDAVRVVKTVHHYLMEGLSDRLKPQAGEGFLEARWVPFADVLKRLAYPTDRSIVAKAVEGGRK